MTQEANDKVAMTGQPELATFAGDGIQVCRSIDEDEIETCFERLWGNSKATAEKRLVQRSLGAETAKVSQVTSPSKDSKSPPLSGAEREERRLRLMSLCRPRQPPAWTCADTFMPVLSSSPALRRKATCSLPPIRLRPSTSPVRKAGEFYDALLEGNGEEASKKVDVDQKDNGSDEEDDNEDASEDDDEDAMEREKVDDEDATNPEDDGGSSKGEIDEEGESKDAKAKKSSRKKKRLKKKKIAGKIVKKASPTKEPLAVIKRGGRKLLPTNSKILSETTTKPVLKKTSSTRKSPSKKANNNDLAGKTDGETSGFAGGKNEGALGTIEDGGEHDNASHDVEEDVSLLSGSHDKDSVVHDDSDGDLAEEDNGSGMDEGDDEGERKGD